MTTNADRVTAAHQLIEAKRQEMGAMLILQNYDRFEELREELHTLTDSWADALAAHFKEYHK